MAQIYNLNSEIYRYEEFINDVLKEDLKKVDKQLQFLNTKIIELQQVQQALDVLDDKDLIKDNYKTQVDIGCNFFIQAKVEDTSTMLYDIGLGHMLELSRKEVRKLVEIRLTAYENGTKQLREKSAKIKAHIKLMLINLGDLQNINNDKVS